MLFFLVPFYFVLFFGWLIYAGLIKKDLKKHASRVFSMIWIIVFAISLCL